MSGPDGGGGGRSRNRRKRARGRGGSRPRSETQPAAPQSQGGGGDDGGEGGKSQNRPSNKGGRGDRHKGNRKRPNRNKGNRGRARAREQAKGRQDPAGFWGDPGALPHIRQDVRITDDPAAVPRSLGPPPLPGHEAVAEHYFTVVYERAVATAGALAAAGGLIDLEAVVEDQ